MYLNISYLQLLACNFCDWRRDNEDDPFPLPEVAWPTQQQMNVTNLMGIILRYPLRELSRLTECYQGLEIGYVKHSRWFMFKDFF